MRIKAGMEDYDGWTYVVLTHDPAKWKYDMKAMWKADGKCWNRLRTRMNKRIGKSHYVCVMERHLKSGQPHSNIAIHNQAMLNVCKIEGCGHIESTKCEPCRGCRETGTKKRLCEGFRKLRQVIRSWAMAAGYGKVIWLEPIYDRAGLAGYLQKLSDLLIGDTTRAKKEELVKELVGSAKKGPIRTQTPDQDAPPHFRRLRPSRGLLPPVKKNPEYTGEMVQKVLEVVEAQLQAEGTLAKVLVPVKT